MERVFGPDDRKTPALTKADGVDYIPLPTWKIFMIQFLKMCIRDRYMEIWKKYMPLPGKVSVKKIRLPLNFSVISN